MNGDQAMFRMSKCNVRFGQDFPEAVSLIEQGRFSTEGIFSHTMPLAEVQRGFEIASQYLDNVIKLVIEL